MRLEQAHREQQNALKELAEIFTELLHDKSTLEQFSPEDIADLFLEAGLEDETVLDKMCPREKPKPHLPSDWRCPMCRTADAEVVSHLGLVVCVNGHESH